MDERAQMQQEQGEPVAADTVSARPIDPTDVHRASGTLASLMACAKHADDMHEGRLREDFLTLSRLMLDSIGALGVGTAAEGEGPRNVFRDGKLITPDGTEWDLG